MEDPNGEKFLSSASLPPGYQLVTSNEETVLLYRGNDPTTGHPSEVKITRAMFTDAIGTRGFPITVKIIFDKGQPKIRFCHLWRQPTALWIVKWKIGDLAIGSSFETIEWKIHERAVQSDNSEDGLERAVEIWLESFYQSQFRLLFQEDAKLADAIFNRPPESPPVSGDRSSTLAPGNIAFYDFVKVSDKESIDRWLAKVDQAYYYGTAWMEDDIYNELIELYESRFGRRVKVGAKPTHDEVALPIAMMSLNKVKKKEELAKWMGKNPGPYIVMDKINGNAGLCSMKTLYNRGDGTTGSDLSHVLPHLKLPQVPEGVYIKGELVINKKDYEPYSLEYKTNLAMINGLLNSRSADPNRLKLFRFIAYDISCNLQMSQTLGALQQSGFTIPFATRVEHGQLTMEWLSAVYKQRKEQAEYDVDGLVIVADRPVAYDERLIRENPSYAIAFKEYGQKAVAVVESIQWKVSKHNRSKPTVVIRPVTLGNYTIQSLTGFNGGWIRDNNVGPGTQLLITHNTIPHILSVVQGTVADLPPNPETWKWNDTQVDIIMLVDSHEVRIAKIHEFFEQIGAKYLGPALVAKLYYAGCTSVNVILGATREQFLMAQIPGVGQGIVDRMMKSIDEALKVVNLARLMSASCEFGMGFGYRKITAILDVYPNILNMNPTLSDICAIHGFAETTAQRFIEALPNFKAWLLNNPVLIKYLQYQQAQASLAIRNQPASVPIDNNNNVQAVGTQSNGASSGGESISGKKVVFTGFRDVGLERKIEQLGGKVMTSVSGNTSVVVVGGVKGTGSGKETKAQSLNIPVLNLEQFKQRFGL